MSATKPFTVGLIQEAVTPDVSKNLNDAIVKIREAHARGAQIVCLQELFNCQYFCKAQKGERFEPAEPIPGPTVTTLQALATELEIVLIVPIFERQAAGVYRNSAAVIDADGSLLGVYRKMHIPDDPLYYEKFYFTPGDLGFRAWQTRYANIGVLICWDQWYPEAARIVLRSRIPKKTMFGLDICNLARIRKPEFDQIVGAHTPVTELFGWMSYTNALARFGDDLVTSAADAFPWWHLAVLLRPAWRMSISIMRPAMLSMPAPARV